MRSIKKTIKPTKNKNKTINNLKRNHNNRNYFFGCFFLLIIILKKDNLLLFRIKISIAKSVVLC